MIWDQGTIDLVLAAMVIEVCDQADAALWQREHHGGEDEIERARRNPPPMGCVAGMERNRYRRQRGNQTGKLKVLRGNALHLSGPAGRIQPRPARPG